MVLDLSGRSEIVASISTMISLYGIFGVVGPNFKASSSEGSAGRSGFLDGEGYNQVQVQHVQISF